MAVLKELAVSPNAIADTGDPAVADMASRAGELDGVIVTVNTEAVVDVAPESPTPGPSRSRGQNGSAEPEPPPTKPSTGADSTA